ncbi:MAG TPA: prepilin-type N-terminal cleavage/methylation domain-containing protein [Candidatus Didemnitutus sp.]|nr:prepilin-type N-terminal cleavage/methylation domain-containing protein [Candidatus Didemnitutus sp.]
MPSRFPSAGSDRLRRPQALLRGFSLVEVMMAAAILVVGFIGLIQAVTISASMLDLAKKQQVATQIMNGELAALQSASWSTIANLADGTTYTMTVDDTGHAGGSSSQFNLPNNPGLLANARNFSCSLTSSYLRPSSPTALTVTYVQVTCTVTWTSITGKSYTRSSQATYGKYGLNLAYQKS